MHKFLCIIRYGVNIQISPTVVYVCGYVCVTHRCMYQYVCMCVYVHVCNFKNCVYSNQDPNKFTTLQ